MDEAVEQFVRVLMAAPESPRVATMMDEAYAQLNAPEECRHTWEMIVKEHPEAQLPLLHLHKHLP
jgi:lipopolysaccharide biosynthesis regulator YciM